MVRNDARTLSVREAADALDVHYMTAYRYVRTGILPATMVGGRWRIRLDDVERRTAPARSAGASMGQRRRHIEDRRTQLVGRLIEGDEPGSWGVVQAAQVSGMDPIAVHLELLAPAMAMIGDGWAAGALTVGQEHRAAAVCHRLVGRLGPRFLRPGHRRGTVVLAGAPGDLHALPVAIAADVVRAAGYGVVDLGADVPVEDVARAVADADRLVAVGITATVGGNEGAVREAVTAARRAAPHRAVLVGGGAVDDAVAASLSVDGYGTDANALVRLLDALQLAA